MEKLKFCEWKKWDYLNLKWQQPYDKTWTQRWRLFIMLCMGSESISRRIPLRDLLRAPGPEPRAPGTSACEIRSCADLSSSPRTMGSVFQATATTAAAAAPATASTTSFHTSHPPQPRRGEARQVRLRTRRRRGYHLLLSSFFSFVSVCFSSSASF